MANQYEYPTIFVKGKVAYCRVASLIQGAELIESNNRSRYPNQNPQPHTALTLYDAEIMGYEQLKPNLDPELVQLLDKKLSPSREGKHVGHTKFNAQNKTGNLPAVYQKDAQDPNSAHQIVLEHELGQDQEVTLAVRTFYTEKYSTTGASLEAVLLPAGDIKYYIPTGGGADLSALGITVSGPTPQVQNQTQAAPETQSNGGGFGGNGFGAPAAQPQTQQAPTPANAPGQTFGGTPAPFGAPAAQPQAQQPEPAQAPQHNGFQSDFAQQTFAAPANEAPAQNATGGFNAPTGTDPSVAAHLSSLQNGNGSAFGGAPQAQNENQPWNQPGEAWNTPGAGISYQPQQ